MRSSQGKATAKQSETRGVTADCSANPKISLLFLLLIYLPLPLEDTQDESPNKASGRVVKDPGNFEVR